MASAPSRTACIGLRVEPLWEHRLHAPHPRAAGPLRPLGLLRRGGPGGGRAPIASALRCVRGLMALLLVLVVGLSIAGMFVTLHPDEPDPVRRLEKVYRTTQSSKEMSEAVGARSQGAWSRAAARGA